MSKHMHNDSNYEDRTTTNYNTRQYHSHIQHDKKVKTNYHIFFSTNEINEWKKFTVLCTVAGITQSTYVSVYDHSIYSIRGNEIPKHYKLFTNQQSPSLFTAITIDGTTPDTFWGTLQIGTIAIAHNTTRNKQQLTLYTASELPVYVITYGDTYWIVNNAIVMLKICSINDLSEDRVTKCKLNANTKLTVTDNATIQVEEIRDDIDVSTYVDKELASLIDVKDLNGDSMKINKLSPITKQIIKDNAVPNKDVIAGINMIWNALISSNNEDAAIEFVQMIEESSLVEMIMGA